MKNPDQQEATSIFQNSLLPYFYSFIAAAAQQQFQGHPVVGPWVARTEYPGDAQIQLHPSSLVPYGERAVRLLTGRAEGARHELAQVALRLQAGRKAVQLLLTRDTDREHVSSLEDFYTEARSLIGLCAGLGFSVEQFLAKQGEVVKGGQLHSWSMVEREAWTAVMRTKSPVRRAQAIAKHVKVYSWIGNDWSGPAMVGERDFLHRHPGRSDSVPGLVVDLGVVPRMKSQLAVYFAALRDERMAYERIVVSLLGRYLQNECARLGHRLEDARMLTVEEFEAHKIGALPRASRIRLFGVSANGVTDCGEEKWLEGASSLGTVLRGEVVHPGYCMGTARIVLSRRDLDRVREGDIIVTAMTRPEFEFVLGRCSGIVASEGGAASHAQYCADWFELPALQQVPFATAVFRDGDLLELDANRGVVRRVVAGKARSKDTKGSRLFG